MMKDIKNMVIKVSNDKKYVEIHTTSNVVKIPFIYGIGRFNLESNIPKIIKEIKEMVHGEGYNHIRAFQSDIVIYNELLFDLNEFCQVELYQ